MTIMTPAEQNLRSHQRQLDADGVMVGVSRQAIDETLFELERLRRGLQIIIDAGGVHGSAWCIAQARGHLEDLDFDSYPETGKPPVTEPVR